MSSKYSAIQSRIREVGKQVGKQTFYVHYNAHSLHLVLVMRLKQSHKTNAVLRALRFLVMQDATLTFFSFHLLI